MSTAVPHKYADLGQRIRRARKRSNISQERLAATVGITRRHLIRIENGEHLPSRALRDRLAEATSLARDELSSPEDEDEESRAVPIQISIDYVLLGRAVEKARAERELA